MPNMLGHDWPQPSKGRSNLAWIRIAALCAALFFCGVSGAEPAPAWSALARIDVTLVGEAAQAKQMNALLSSWLSAEPAQITIDQTTRLRAEDVLNAANEPGTLRIWLVLASRQRARLYFADPNDRRYLVRDLPLHDGLDELGREQLAQVLMSSIQAFRDRTASSSPAEVQHTFEPARPKPVMPSKIEAPKPRPQAAEPTRVAIGAGLSYAAIARGDEGLGHGPGWYLNLAVPFSNLAGTLTLRSLYRLPVEQQSDRIALSLRAIDTQLSAGLQGRLSREVLARGEFGGGLAYVKFSPKSLLPDQIAARHRDHDLRPFVLFGARLAYARAPWELAALFTLTVPLVHTHYDLIQNGEQTVELSPWRAQPGLALEAGWD